MGVQNLVQFNSRDFLFWLSRVVNYPLVPPDMLQLCFTFKCNLRCKMCSMHKKQDELRKSGKPYELSFSLMKDLISQAQAMKIKEVYFVGGEPLLEERIFDLIAHASRLGMKTVVNTNGVLVDDEKIDRIFDSGLSFIVFSVDGPDKETYEKIRGEDVFDKVIHNLKNLISQRIKKSAPHPWTTILCTVMKQNIHRLPEMVAFAKEIGVDAINYQPVVPDNTDQACDAVSDTWVTPEGYTALDESIDRLIQLKNSGFEGYICSSFEQLRLMKLYFRGHMPMIRKCYLGFSRLIVTQNQRVYFCVSDPQTGGTSFGDVSRIPLRTLWRSKAARRFRRHIKACQRPCLLGCSYRTDFDIASDNLDKIVDTLRVFSRRQ